MQQCSGAPATQRVAAPHASRMREHQPARWPHACKGAHADAGTHLKSCRLPSHIQAHTPDNPSPHSARPRPARTALHASSRASRPWCTDGLQDSGTLTPETLPAHTACSSALVTAISMSCASRPFSGLASMRASISVIMIMSSRGVDSRPSQLLKSSTLTCARARAPRIILSNPSDGRDPAVHGLLVTCGWVNWKGACRISVRVRCDPGDDRRAAELRGTLAPDIHSTALAMDEHVSVCLSFSGFSRPAAIPRWKHSPAPRLLEQIDERCGGGRVARRVAPAVRPAAGGAGRGALRGRALRRHKAPLGQLLQLVAAPGQVAHEVPVEARLLPARAGRRCPGAVPGQRM
jgi:hypothetical protein